MSRSVHTAEYEELRRQLIDRRKAAGITQQQLAALLDKPQSFVSKFENGERRLDVVEFLQVVRALGADPHQIIRSVTRQSAAARPRRSR